MRFCWPCRTPCPNHRVGIHWSARPQYGHAVIVGADGKAWCGLPSAPVIVDGRHYVINGKKQYRPAVEWRDRDRSDRFSERVLTLLLNIYPDALDADAEAAA